MDEEDLREAEDARNLTTSENFAGFGLTEHDSVRTTGLIDILRPTGETIGHKLLKRMGWKEGQGIGPKVKRRANMGEGEIEDENIYLFAPKNTAMISFSRKSDQKGLGYQGERHLQTTSKASTSLEDGSDDEVNLSPASLLKNKRTAVKGKESRAFGVGVLNDTGSDDEDAYEIGPKISYGKVIGGEKKAKKKGNTSQSNANPLVKTKPTFLSKKLLSAKVGGFRRCRDGRLPLDGFILADELDGFASISLQDDSMKPPVVPTNWVSTRNATTSTESRTYVSAADAAKSSSLNAQSRAALLGEKQLPSKSVFDYLSPHARNKLASASGKVDLPEARGERPPPGYESSEAAKQKNLHDLVPALDSQVALQALSRGVDGWMPYAEDESKRQRYRSFLEIRAGLLDQVPGRAKNATQDEWVNEMIEFSRAAQVFKPVTGLMASRFTSSSAAPKSVHESDENVTEDALLKKSRPRVDGPAVAAAKMGMFGPMTRSVENFFPSRLVCKRFNVQPPENAMDGSDILTSSARRGRSSQFHAYEYEPRASATQPLIIKNEAHGEEAESAHHVALDSDRSKRMVSTDPGTNDALEKERPGQDVFRAVFGSDDEEGDN